MRPIHRWSLVSLACALITLVPMAVRALPVHDSSIGAAQLLARIRASGDTTYSGMVETTGRLGLPVSDHFTDVADLLGGDTRLRVWWRGSSDWRVDRLLATGEVDLFHHGGTTITWDYERAEAQTSVDPAVRLPRDADLLPPALARRALDGAGPREVSRLPARRIAGIAAPGIRLRPADPRTSVDHVDLWADPATGLVLALDAYGAAGQPAISTTFTSITERTPPPAATAFHPAPGLHVRVDNILDIADAADQFAPVRPPAEIAGLAKSASTPEAVGIYGHGLTQLMALPLQARDAGYLADQLRKSGAATSAGALLLRAGPLGVYLVFSHDPFDFAWLLTGMVTDDTLVRAADDLRSGATFR
ncbi:MAG: hypothetical protein WB797_03300 [Nocardioides sp.]